MTAPELAPCPWCCNTPQVDDGAFYYVDGDVHFGAVRCTSCFANGPIVRTNDGWELTAAAAWNTWRRFEE